jgi:hypothetical protein
MMKDHSSAYLQVKKDRNWKRIVTTSSGLILNEGDYYILRNGQIVYLMDNLVISDYEQHPFYMRVKDTREMIGSVNWEGKHLFHKLDIIGVCDRPSLTTSNAI